MDHAEITRILTLPYSEQLLARDILRMAYVSIDGSPRNVPMGFVWNGSEIVVCTTTNAPKLRHLRANPQVALTIDTEEFPPKILLIRGSAALEVVDGIPEEYLSTNNVYSMTPEQRAEWEAEVHSLYKQMVRIRITPTWVKLIDFESTLPTAVEQLVAERDAREQT
ncbi:MAG: pyridoxamine 5'-phosphate oxidase family protein [Microbacterium gubbeenense]